MMIFIIITPTISKFQLLKHNEIQTASLCKTMNVVSKYKYTQVYKQFITTGRDLGKQSKSFLLEAHKKINNI